MNDWDLGFERILLLILLRVLHHNLEIQNIFLHIVSYMVKCEERGQNKSSQVMCVKINGIQI